ncbi:hypothetical protein HSB1_32790 [Halogranum salarium B-1]|uniref:Uncharacterized protein n=1 Tax=Halogranum salarium B-1 TaxID=1210908 RepID=J3EU67_9EURY|nr:hypothetical protein HSB1_32790 [Halogranum salarium B-1]
MSSVFETISRRVSADEGDSGRAATEVGAERSSVPERCRRRSRDVDGARGECVVELALPTAPE